MARPRRELFHGEAIEVVGEVQGAGIAPSDFGLGLLLLSQGSEHAMREDEVLHMGVAGDLSDDRRRHVEVALDSDGAFRDSVVGDEYVRVHCQLNETFAFAVRVTAKDDAFAANFYAPSQGRDWSVNHAN